MLVARFLTAVLVIPILVGMTFDDGWLSQYQNVVPKLNSSGLKATFFITSKQMADDGFPGYMSRAQVREVLSQGHEIGAHTRTHPYLSQLSAADQQTQIEGSKADLTSYGFGHITDFAYPFGDYNSTTVSLVKSDGFVSARTTNGGFTNPTSDDFLLPRQGVDSGTTLAQVESWIDRALANKEWLILVFHRVDESGSTYSTTPAIFNAIIDYLVSKNAKVVTIEQGMTDMPK